MRWIAGSILVLAVVVAVIGWRATTHHKARQNPNSYFFGKP